MVWKVLNSKRWRILNALPASAGPCPGIDHCKGSAANPARAFTAAFETASWSTYRGNKEQWKAQSGVIFQRSAAPTDALLQPASPQRRRPSDSGPGRRLWCGGCAADTAAGAGITLGHTGPSSGLALLRPNRLRTLKGAAMRQVPGSYNLPVCRLGEPERSPNGRSASTKAKGTIVAGLIKRPRRLRRAAQCRLLAAS